MDTAKMKRLVKMDSLKSYELLQRVKQLAGDALEIQNTLESSFLREQVIEVVEGFYDLGKVIDAYEIFGGYTNRSFQVVVEQNGVTREYFLRKYKFGVSKKEILFEHAMINHTAANGFHLLATVVPASDGDTFVSPAISKNNFAMFHFLEGEDKYSWDNPLMEDGEYESGAEVLASFHNASQGFEQHAMGRLEPIVPGILELIPGYIQSFSDYAKVDRSTKFHTYFTTALQSILSSLKAYRISGEDADRMVLNPVHGDYHPGNLKFSGGRVVGVFDLDWAKIDFRLFDVCFALIYNSVYWGGRDDGNMLPDKCALFLKFYQSTLVKTGSLSPLNNIELDNFPTMIAMANFYLLNWEITDYYFDSDRNDYEYLAYLKHNIRQMHWIDSHIKELAAVADSLRV